VKKNDKGSPSQIVQATQREDAGKTEEPKAEESNEKPI
jgi:hypothetical protein